MGDDHSKKQLDDSAREFAANIADTVPDAVKSAAGRAAQGASNAVGEALTSMGERLKTTEAASGASAVGADGAPAQTGKAKGRGKAIIVAVAIAVLAIVGLLAMTMLSSGANKKLTPESYVTAAALEKAVAIENLATAEFVYKGVAEHYAPGFFPWEASDRVDYRILYGASVKTTINLTDVTFEVDNNSKVVSVQLPDFQLSTYVEPDSVKYIPQNTSGNPREDLDTCAEDVEREARDSNELREKAEENLRATIEALTVPILGNSGYTIEWAASTEDAGSENNEEEA